MQKDILRLQVESTDEAVVIRCEGELDLSVRDHFREAIDRSTTPGVAVIRIDTSGVTFMDSSALGCLIETDQRCREQGTRVEIIPSAPVTRLFELAGWSPIAARNGHAPGRADAVPG